MNYMSVDFIIFLLQIHIFGWTYPLRPSDQPSLDGTEVTGLKTPDRHEEKYLYGCMKH